MAEKIRIDHGTLKAGKRLLQAWKIPVRVKREVLRFLDDLALGKVNRGKKLSEDRQLKYLHALRIPLQFFNKPTECLCLRDIEAFEKALTSGQIRTRLKHEPFAHNTQVDIRILLRIFLRWRLGESTASKLAGWLDTRSRPKTPDFLKEAEVERLYKYCRSAEQRFLIAILFDSGARAEEFHNLRYEDVYLPEEKSNFVRIALKQEYSKTLGRTITLYWKYSLEAVQEYLSERVAEGIKPADPLFRGQYSATRKFMHRLGQKVLKKSVHYHLFRHSSVTWYAAKLNRQELCYRYGWRFSTAVVDIYISRSGMETKALDEKFTQTELGTVKDEVVKLQQEGKIKDDRIAQLQESIKAMELNLDMVTKLLNRNPSIGDVDSALKRRQKQQGEQIQ